MKILNFGSLNLDFVYAVDHLVSPGETLSASRLTINCGGKGLNQSVALARAGLEVYHAGKVGPDGRMLVDLLEENGVDTHYICTSGERTGNAVIQVDKAGQNSILLYGGANHDIGPDMIRSVTGSFEKGSHILLQNEISHLDYCLEQAWQNGMKIIFNPSPANDAITSLPLQYVSVFLLNEVEGGFLTGLNAPEDILHCLHDRYPHSAVVLTLGEKGVMYQNHALTLSHDIFPSPVVDTTGAGDTFTGYFVAAILQGAGVPAALKQASMASSIAVSRTGAAASIPGKEEVLARLCALEQTTALS